jgi:hypothetical protein
MNRPSAWLVTAVAGLIALTGCRTPGTPPAALPPQLAVAAGQARAQFAAALPDTFQRTDSVVIEFKPHWWWPAIRVTALGATDVDRAHDAFTAVGLTPMGVRLFDVSRRDGQVQAHFLTDRVPHQEAVTKALSDDMARLYLNLIPSAEAKVHRERDTLVFREETAEIATEFVFAGQPAALVGKRCWEGRQRVCVIRFDEYEGAPTARLPARIVLDNLRYHYRVTIRLKANGG